MKRSLSRLAVVLAGAAALVGPAALEWSALQQLRAALGACPDGPRPDPDASGATTFAPAPTPAPTCGGVARADIDLDGLRLWHPWRERAGLRLEADEITITADTDGVSVDVHAARVQRMAAPTSPAPATDPPRPSAEAPDPPAPRRARLDTHGVPVHVRVHGSTQLEHAGLTVTLDDPTLELDGHGQATARFGLTARGRGLDVVGTDRFTASTVDGDLRRWQAQGVLQLSDGPPAAATVRLEHDRVETTIHDGAGGRLGVRAPLPTAGRRRPEALDLRAERFALATLGQLGHRTLERWGLDASGATLDAALRLEHVDAPAAPHLDAARRDDALPHGQAQLERLTLEGLVVDHPKLAREPIHLSALDVHGRVSWQGEALAGQVWLAHRGARVSLTAQLEPDALDLHTELAPIECQALLDSIPDAMAEMIAGTRLSGTLDGHAELHLDRRALAALRAIPAKDRDRDAPPPGHLDFSFPFLERCTVVQDDPRLDLAALAGPYRHRFVDHRGRLQTRVMARGGPGYVSVDEVPLLARAFVTLEDRRFWSHDGFDREQIAYAFWHNLVQGRVSRGASTISQQATRNLWLGVDRSFGRKIQEALLTARLEASTDKARIMELYLNVIELGPGVHGVQDAAMLYFGKPAAELSVLQAIHVAAMAPAPRRFALEHLDGQPDDDWMQMLHEHVRRMHRAGFIDRPQMLAALRADLELLDRRASAPPG